MKKTYIHSEYKVWHSSEVVFHQVVTRQSKNALNITKFQTALKIIIADYVTRC